MALTYRVPTEATRCAAASDGAPCEPAGAFVRVRTAAPVTSQTSQSWLPLGAKAPRGPSKASAPDSTPAGNVHDTAFDAHATFRPSAGLNVSLPRRMVRASALAAGAPSFAICAAALTSALATGALLIGAAVWFGVLRLVPDGMRRTGKRQAESKALDPRANPELRGPHSPRHGLVSSSAVPPTTRVAAAPSSSSVSD